MIKNLGNADRIIRLVLAAVLVILVLTDVLTSTRAVVSLIIAGIFVVTALINFCPLYHLFGIRTGKQ